MDAREIRLRLLNKMEVSDAEKAFLIKNDPHVLGAFMIENNPGSVNFTLRSLGYDLPFTPNAKALGRQLDILINRADTVAIKDFTSVVKNFNVRQNGLSPELLNELTKQFNS